MAMPADDLELQLAAQQGLIPGMAAPAAPPSGALPAGRALADAVMAAPNIPFVGNPGSTAPAGLPALGVPIAPAPPPQFPVAPPALPAAAPIPETPVAAPPVAGGGGGGTPGGDGMGGAVAEVKAAGQEETKVGQDAVRIAEDKAKADADADRLKAEEAQASTDRLSALQGRQKQAYDAARADFAKAREDVSNFQFHQFFANPTDAKTVLSGIGMLLGGVSYDAHHVNQAVNVIQAGIDRDSKQQLDYLHSKEHVAELAQQGIRDTQSYLAHEMANFQTAEALKKEAVAAQIDALSSTTRGKQNINAAQAVAAKLRESAAKDSQAAIIQGTHNRVMQSEITLNRAKAASEGVGRAAKVQTAAEVAAEKVVAARLKDNKTVTTLLKEKEELGKADSASVPDPKTGRVNGTAFQAAVDGFTKAITGLGARKGSIDMTTGAFGGLVDKIKRNVQKGIDGTYTAHDVQVFRDGLQKVSRANQLSLQTSRKLDETAFARHPLTKGQKDVYQTALDQRYGGGAEVAPETADPNAEARAWATSNPNDPRAAKILARLGQ